ncbi:hypothetical protein BGX38DRAFT_1147651 [Terfezia claveryi]|nr:hypothetical protein BGX38DRAFT_1147651 [Terfezia claveryi]
MRGNFDETFFDSINKVFICLVTSVMRHCLKSWTIGVYVEPPKTGDFKYDTSISTWNANPRKVRTLLLAAIKADIGAQLAAAQLKGCLESDQPLNIGDTSAFEAELTQELLQAKQATQLAWQRIPDSIRRLAHAEEDEDHSLELGTMPNARPKFTRLILMHPRRTRVKDVQEFA